MKRKALLQYKKTRVSTTSRERILLMLYDGAIRFLEHAKQAIDQNQFHTKGEKISKAHAVISELNATLDHAAAPELCQNLQALYLFMLDELSQANRSNSIEKIDIVIELLDDLRGAWRQVIEQQQTGGAGQKPQLPRQPTLVKR